MLGPVSSFDPFDLLDVAADAFTATANQLTNDDWSRPTPCTDWDVGRLVDHVVGGNRFTTFILAGLSAESAMRSTNASFANDSSRARAVSDSMSAQRAAFRQPGALERVCHHVAGDLPAARILGFRITDLTLHRWDLARATGMDEGIDDRLVEAVWADMGPYADDIAAIGQFGSGPTGIVGDAAPLAVRMLDLSGRRP